MNVKQQIRNVQLMLPASIQAEGLPIIFENKATYQSLVTCQSKAVIKFLTLLQRALIHVSVQVVLSSGMVSATTLMNVRLENVTLKQLCVAIQSDRMNVSVYRAIVIQVRFRNLQA